MLSLKNSIVVPNAPSSVVPTFMAKPIPILTNTPEALKGLGIADFWSWAFSDLCDDDLKGVFAEWLVIRLIGHESIRRVSFANSDIILQSGVRIEIKATAFWQSWKLVAEDGSLKPTADRFRIANERDLRFTGLQSRNSVGITNVNDIARYKSDIYVFCFEHERDPKKWNAMDLTQWEFYIVTVDQLSARKASSVSVANLREMHSPMCAAEFRTVFEDIVSRYQQRPNESIQAAA